MDMRKARDILTQEGCTCVLCAGDTVYKSDHRGVSPLLELLDAGTGVEGFCAADKVVGKATAFLYCLLGVRAVHGCVMSAAAATVLTEHGIIATWDTLVEGIRNRTNDGPCPMEKATQLLRDPVEALRAIRQTLQQLKK